jgi:nucleotide-binding universal stress UspA family protein
MGGQGAECLQDLSTRHPNLAQLRELETLLAVGIPVTRILEVAKQSDAQIIVMGSQGRTGLPHLLVGSKAERVVQLALISVVIVKADREELEESGKQS